MTLRRDCIDNGWALCIMALGHGSRDSFCSLNLLFSGSRFLASDGEIVSLTNGGCFYLPSPGCITGKLSRNSMKRLIVIVTLLNTAPVFAQTGIESSGFGSLLSRKFAPRHGEFAEYERRHNEKQKNKALYCST